MKHKKVVKKYTSCDFCGREIKPSYFNNFARMLRIKPGIFRQYVDSNGHDVRMDLNRRIDICDSCEILMYQYIKAHKGEISYAVHD